MRGPRPHQLVVLSVSAGAGHVRAAEALCAAAEREFPRLRATHIDVMDVVPTGFRKLYAGSYLKLVEKMPLVWSYLYQRTDRRSANSRFDQLRRSVERLNTRRLERELDRLAPDAIVCTHFLPAELLSRRKARARPTPPVWVQVTDFDVHGLWIHPHMQGYFAANDEIAWRIAARGIMPEQIFTTGIPIMPQFSAAPSRADAAAELGLDPRQMTLLMMSGGAGVGGIEALAERLVMLPNEVQIIALAGRNQALLATLRAIARRHPKRLFPLGYTRTIERVMAAADLAITKPGGLTTSECLAMGLPM